MRLIAALLLAIGFAYPAIAQDDQPPPSWAGVWEGTIGRYKVMVCLDQRYDGAGQGSYYYLSQLRPIKLQADRSAQIWAEGDGEGWAGSTTLPGWRFYHTSEERITGLWRSGQRRLPIALKRIADGAEDAPSPCASANFLAPRLKQPEFTRDNASIAGLSYTRVSYVPPAYFEDVEIAGFTFPSQQPGDEEINQWLGGKLPKGRADDEFLQCLAGVLMLYGVDGYYSMSLAPDFANAELLAVSSANSSYCGGAHPNHWQEYYTFDRKTDDTLDPFNWFNADGMTQDEYGSKLMADPLRAAVMNHWPVYEDEADECSGFAADQEWWKYQARGDGILFQPDFPHVITACEEEVLVPWSKLEPFLSEAGKTLRERASR